MIKVLFVPGDLGACGYYRMLQQMRHLQLEYGDVCPVYLGPLTLQYAGQQVTVAQRVVSPTSLQALINFKENHHTKVVLDYDDLLWEPHEGKLHKYNMFLNKLNLKECRESLEKYLDFAADLVTVSCERLKDEISDFVPEEKIAVVPNYLAIRDWCFDRTSAIINEDNFFYAGSLSHYNNEKKQHGDFSIPLAKFLEKQRTMFMGDEPPWFFQNCIQSTGWVDLNVYPNALYQNTRYAKFTLAPIEENIFNTCKSDLKYLESCAVGRVCIVSDFPGSPYAGAHPMQKMPQNASIDEIRGIVEKCKEHYAEILDYQYEYLNTRWLDAHKEEYTRMLLDVAG